ncbi:hypothetical protein DIQ79_31765 [Mycolicibacterium smegmatis]|uniref:Uncharacterized protein n=1 Tax=Mycolicibacterium smegmatis (strain ATCC 700084 / mc(2)155) TaxID=246196 RepID=A0QZK0_MYCS2|nr:hypothetical protein MSMEG_4052 [Mycolicibacterium smegmatis MC2 155]TBM37510.1 hypothetical protein DIQ86_30030 [Mycolicibacterium smegmatis]TBH27053.1 hypothetical protein EYS45_31645 [Mycolicibacterium smegmatis MC2 155]TBM44161.1 hypothetical protein DIQ85_31695 [Mycolicibacterium smegmatis]TBM54060.1 hypothetical protein DIQ83_32015 [Mycolicibacterium smegmatis]
MEPSTHQNVDSSRNVLTGRPARQQEAIMSQRGNHAFSVSMLIDLPVRELRCER